MYLTHETLDKMLLFLLRIRNKSYTMKHIFQLSVFFNNTCYTFTDILLNFSKNLIKVTNKQNLN